MTFAGTICVAQPEFLFGKAAESNTDPKKFYYGLIAAMIGAVAYGMQFWPLKLAHKNGGTKLTMLFILGIIGSVVSFLLSKSIPGMEFVGPPYSIGSVTSLALPSPQT